MISQLIEFNKDQQIQSRMAFCSLKENRDSRVCGLAGGENTYDAWLEYYSADDNKNVFSKGMDRFETWKQLFLSAKLVFKGREIKGSDDDGVDNFLREFKKIKAKNPDLFVFVCAGLIVIFQVFGDGNHRTANFLYEKVRRKEIRREQMEGINDLLRVNDYSSIADEPGKMDTIIRGLISVFNMPERSRSRSRSRSRRSRSRSRSGRRSRSRSASRGGRRRRGSRKTRV